MLKIGGNSPAAAYVEMTMTNPPASPRPRRAGSARFTTYYKVQW
jgi:hypothetical protein